MRSRRFLLLMTVAVDDDRPYNADRYGKDNGMLRAFPIESLRDAEVALIRTYPIGPGGFAS